MKRRSGFTVMAKLIGLVKPLTGFMVLAIIMGLAGHLFAAFITIFGGYAVLTVLGFETAFGLKAVFLCVLLFAVLRAVLRYAGFAEALSCKIGGQGQGGLDLGHYFGY